MTVTNKLKLKITYGILTILLLAGLYFGLRFAFGLFTPYNFWTARQDIKDGKIQIIEIGELPLNFEQKQKLAKSYGFNFSQPGCNATTDVLNGVEYYNIIVVEHLKNKYGDGWWTKFHNQIDSIDKATTANNIIADIKGKWFINKWTMYHTLSFGDTTVFVDNHIDSVFTLLYSLSYDTLSFFDNKSNMTYHEKIITLTTDTLIIKSLRNKKDILGYSRIKREWINE
jgi:hypothetical protein